MPADVRDERRLVGLADLRGVAAARVEVAAARRVDGAGYVALEHDSLALRQRIGNRHGREQRLRVGVDRAVVKLLGRRKLDDLAEVHDRDAVGDMPDDAEIVGDEDIGQRELVLQVVEQVHDLRLNRDVECRDGLVGHDQPGVERERARHADALALTARELVRIAIVVLGREADDVHQLLHAFLRFRPRLPVDHERVGDDRAHPLARVERCRRVLEHHLQLAPQRPQSPAAEPRDVAALEDDLPRGQLVQAHEAAAERRLAAAGLADETERLTRVDLEADAVDGLHARDLAADDPAALDREVLRDLARLEQDLAVHAESSGWIVVSRRTRFSATGR
jgi:hypothetical protein